MKAILDPKLLAKELKKLSPVIKKTTVLPILTCVKMSFSKSNVVITATDLETTMICSTPCESKSSFELIIEFGDLVDVCNKAHSPITIEPIENRTKILSDDLKFEFSTNNPPESFPVTKDEDYEIVIEPESDFFFSLWAANNCKNPSHPRMNAACIDVKKDKIFVVGTDAFVLYKSEIKIKTGKTMQAMVAETFIQMSKSYNGGTVSISEKFIKVVNGTDTIISRLLDSKFCGYEVIFPEKIEFNLQVNRSAFIESLSAVGIASSKSTNLCSILFGDGEIKLLSEDIDFGKTSEARLKVSHSVSIENIGVNIQQLVKLLNFLDSEEVEISFRENSQTIFIKPFGEPNTICLIQPIFTNI